MPNRHQLFTAALQRRLVALETTPTWPGSALFSLLGTPIPSSTDALARRGRERPFPEFFARPCGGGAVGEEEAGWPLLRPLPVSEPGRAGSTVCQR